MNIGLYINANYQDAIEQVALADKLGFSSVWLTEKHFDQGHLLWSSPLIAASYIAAKTQRIKIGFAAAVSTLHHPVRLAEDFANLDVLSDGWLIIGLTRSSLSKHCHKAFQSPSQESWEKFNEQFAIMCKLWQDNFNDEHYGFFYKIPKIKLYPKLVQKPLPPIFLVADSNDSIIDAAQKGIGIFLHAFQTINDIQKKTKLYKECFVDVLGLGPRIVLSRLAYVSMQNQQATADINIPLMQFFAEHMPTLVPTLEKEYQTTIDFDFIDKKIAVFGDAYNCLNQLTTITQITGIQNFVLLMNLATLEHQQSLESMKHLAKKAFQYQY